MQFISAAAILSLWMLAGGMVGSVLAADPPVSAPRFEASGIILQDDDRAWALITEPQHTQGKTRMVGPGDTIGPYRLVTIARDHIVLRGPTDVPLKVPFSWRSSGGGEATAAARSTQGQPGTAAQPVGPGPRDARGQGAGATVEAGRETADRSDAVADPGPAASAASDERVPTAAQGSRVAQPQAPRPPQAGQPRSSTADAVARMEELRRARDRTFRQELSIDGYFNNDKK